MSFPALAVGGRTSSPTLLAVATAHAGRFFITMSSFERAEALPRGLIAVLHLSFAQWLAGLAVGLLTALGGASFLGEEMVGAGFDLQGLTASLTAVGLGLMGTVLLVGQRNDLRVSYLGAVLLLSASAFSLHWLIPLEGLHTASGVIAQLLAVAPAEALLPFCLWRFAGLFPSALDTPRMKLVLRVGTFVALIAGVFFIAGNLLLSLLASDWLYLVDHRDEGGAFQWFLGVMCPPALMTSVVRFRSASLRDRARARLLMLPFLLVAGLVFAVAVAMVAQGLFGDKVGALPDLLQVVFLVVALALLPALAFSVSAKRALNARLLAPRLLWDLARRGALLGLTTLPILMFLTSLFVHEGAVDPQNGKRLFLWFFASVFAVGGFFSRRFRLGVLEGEGNGRNDAGLTTAMDNLRKSSHPQDWERWLRWLPGVLGSTSVCLLGVARSSGSGHGALERYVPVADGESFELLSLFRVRSGAIDLESSNLAEDVSGLAKPARRWLAAQGIAVLQPLFATNSELLGVLAVGSKVDQRPFGPADLSLVAALAQAMSLFLEQRIVEDLRVNAETAALPVGRLHERTPLLIQAVQCLGCDRVFANTVAVCPECEHPTFSIDEPLILGGKFQLVRCIGAGTLGKVYEAHDFVLDRNVAIKFIADDTAQGLRILTREARALAALDSSHLATVYTAESEGNRLFVVCELLTGGTLQEQLGTRPWREVVSFGLELLEALEPLHQLEMVHGDLKPSNIGFDHRGRLKLLDFGMVRLLDETADLGTPVEGTYRSSTVLPGGHVGTPLYSPPEAWRGEVVGVAADLWPTAAILWELLTGQHPFERSAETSAEAASLTRAAILNAVRHPVSVRIKGAENLQTLLGRALHVEPGQRYVDVAAFRRGLVGL